MGQVIWERELLRAQNPYYSELAGVNIYDLEELNYFLQKYFYLIDNTSLNDNLIMFLQELNRPDLARLIYGNVGKSHPIITVSKLIIGIDRIWGKDPQRWREKAAEFQRLSPSLQKLKQANILFGNQQFESARVQYESIWEDVKANRIELESEEIARTCYHLAHIAMESMSWKSAGSYLQEAYELTGNQEILKELYMLTCMSSDIVCDNGIFRDVSAKTVRTWNQEFNRKKEALEAQRSLAYYEDLLHQDGIRLHEDAAESLLLKWQEDFRKISKNSCQEMNSSV